jgi:hypothetical protein
MITQGARVHSTSFANFIWDIAGEPTGVSLAMKSRLDHRVTEVPRKVRTPKSEVMANGHPGKPAGLVPQKINRR